MSVWIEVYPLIRKGEFWSQNLTAFEKNVGSHNWQILD